MLNCYLISIPSHHAERIPGIDELYLACIWLNNKKSMTVYTSSYKEGIIEGFVNKLSLAKMEIKYQRWPKLVSLDGPKSCFRVKSRSSWGEKCTEKCHFLNFLLKGAQPSLNECAFSRSMSWKAITSLPKYHECFGHSIDQGKTISKPIPI